MMPHFDFALFMAKGERERERDLIYSAVAMGYLLCDKQAQFSTASSSQRLWVRGRFHSCQVRFVTVTVTDSPPWLDASPFIDDLLAVFCLLSQLRIY